MIFVEWSDGFTTGGIGWIGKGTEVVGTEVVGMNDEVEGADE